MEQDQNIARLIRESGVVNAPDGFSENVMNTILAGSVKQAYKPLIGKLGRRLIILGILAITTITLIYSEPGVKLIEITGRIPEIEWQMPEWSINLEFLSNINISTGIVAGVVALFILVLSDAGLNRRRLA